MKNIKLNVRQQALVNEYYEYGKTVVVTNFHFADGKELSTGQKIRRLQSVAGGEKGFCLFIYLKSFDVIIRVRSVKKAFEHLYRYAFFCFAL